MDEHNKPDVLANLPAVARQYIELIIRKMRYRKAVRADVMAELAAHFEDELAGCKSEEERNERARYLIESFGDAKLLGVLLRRAKKRCRPLWRTVIARTFQTVGILFVCLIVYTVWFSLGKPTITVDYLARLNELGRPTLAPEDNAWPEYEKAIELYVDANEATWKIISVREHVFAQLASGQQQMIRQWLSDNEPAWEYFRRAAAKKYCYRQYHTKDPNDTWLMGVLMPGLAELRRLGGVGMWRAKLAVYEGDTGQGLDDCLSVVRAGAHLQDRVTTIERLVGLSIARIGEKEILRTVSVRDLPMSEVVRVQENLTSVYGAGYPPMINIEGERMGFLDTVQQLFTKGGPGGGHLVPGLAARIIPVEDFGDANGGCARLPVIGYYDIGFIHARRDATVAKINEIYDRFVEMSRLTPYERYVRNIDADELVRSLPERRYYLVRAFMPSFERLLTLRFEGQAGHDATLAVLALLRYQKQEGRYPESLDELVLGGYLKELPMDPYSDGPLVYSRGEKGFVLYSLSRNFKDDGGVMGTGRSGKPRNWADDGDSVFWPPQF